MEDEQFARRACGEPEQNREFAGRSGFRPSPAGCVRRNLRLANAVKSLYAAYYSAVAADIYRSLVSERSDRALSDLFDGIAEGELECFRLLGDLVRALGGSGCFRMTRCAGASSCRNEPESALLARECRNEKERMLRRCEELLSVTEDPVAKNVLENVREKTAGACREISRFCSGM